MCVYLIFNPQCHTSLSETLLCFVPGINCFVLLLGWINSKRNVAGSESDILDSISRQTFNKCPQELFKQDTSRQYRSNTHQKQVPPFLKSHSDWELVANNEDGGLSFQTVGDMMRTELEDPVYSIPDLSLPDKHNLLGHSSSVNENYYSTTTDSEPHEAFRVCLPAFL